MSNDGEQIVKEIDSEDNFSNRLDEFKVLVSFSHVEAQLIWQRYNVMLAANAIIAVFLGVIFADEEISPRNSCLLIFASTGGFALCHFWYKITMHGWVLSHKWLEEAEKHPFKYYKNPYVLYEEWRKGKSSKPGFSDPIGYCARNVINIFKVAYILIFTFSIINLIDIKL